MEQNNMLQWSESRWFKSVCVTFFVLSGMILTAVQLLIAPSFWYVPCSSVFALGGLLWLKPVRGASFGLPLTLAFVGEAITYRFWMWHGATLLVFAGLLAIAYTLIAVATIGSKKINWRWLCISLILITISLTVDREFTKQIRVRHITANWSADPHLPWGDAMLGEHGQVPVTIYVVSPDGYCYDSIFSKELKSRLLASHRPTTEVTYNLIYDWGKNHAYNIGSVAGITFNDGLRSVRNEDSEGGFVEIDRVPNPSKCHE